MALPEIIDCRLASIAKEIAPVDQKFALIVFNLQPDAMGSGSPKPLSVIERYFDKSDTKIWLDDHLLVVLSCWRTKECDLAQRIEKVEGAISCKSGVVYYPEDGRSLNILTSKACKISDPMIAGPKRALEQAISDKEFLVYQPQVNSKTGEFIGVEALIRWRPVSTEKIVMPLEFLPIAETVGMMDQICKWCLYEACRQSLVWQAQNNPIRISVNISTTYILNPDFLKDLDSILLKTGVNPKLLEIEITENKGINKSNIAYVVNVIQNVRSKGILVSIDDFGMEYNSLELLRVLPVDRIKIDKVFVQNIKNHRVNVIIQGTIGIAKAIGINCIAEGVETPYQVAMLEKMGCFDMQGYLFGKPQTSFPTWKGVAVM